MAPYLIFPSEWRTRKADAALLLRLLPAAHHLCQLDLLHLGHLVCQEPHVVDAVGLHVSLDLPPGQPLVAAQGGEGAGHQGAGADHRLVPGKGRVKLLARFQVQRVTTVGTGQARAFT